MKRVCLFLLYAACAAEVPPTRPPLVSAPSASATTASIPPAPKARDDGRLPALATPLRYAIHLDIDPRKDAFTGHVDVMVDVPVETAHVVMNARDIHVREASARIGSSTLPLTTTTRPSHGALEPDELVLSASRLLPKGHVVLSITYDAPFNKTLSGLYVATDAGARYAFTQFEAADARRAFPCFDEPGFKTPFDVTLTVPSDMLALSNGPETSRTPDGASTTFGFATTAPIPTYLVAFAVGTFNVVLGQKADPPIRFITTRGRGGAAQLSLKAATDIVPLLAKYFGIAYPYDKLDLVAVPDFGAGGMENAGIITFRDDAVLIDEHASLRQKRGMLGLMAHELAHQWFGDLVTMKWWDDLWLNEGFATWTTYKIVDAYDPALGTKVDAAASAESVMDQDALASTRAIRQHAASVGDAMNAFDGITYQKGAAVLRMIEHDVGEGVFQRGVHAYLSTHAWGNATASDLLSAIDAAAGNHETSDVAQAYLDQPGVPVVVVDALACDKQPEIRVHEERYAPLGASFPTTGTWKVPLCVLPEKSTAPACKLLGTEPATLGWSGACPAFANPGATGYYRVEWPWGAMPALVKNVGGQPSATRLAAIADAWAQARAGKLSATLLLRTVLPAFDGETDRRVIEKLVSVLYGLSDIVDETTWSSFAGYVRARLGPHLARLARLPEARLDDDQRLLRRTLTAAEIDLGEDAALLDKMVALAKKPGGVDVDYAQVAIELAARKGDPRVLRAAMETAKTPQEHILALRAAAGVIDPEAVRAQLDWAFSGAVKLQDVRGIMWTLASRHRTRPVVLEYVRQHWDTVRGKLPGVLGRTLVGLAGLACTQTTLDASRVFFTQKTSDIEGAERPLAQALESASLCVALRDKLLPQIKATLGTNI